MARCCVERFTEKLIKVARLFSRMMIPSRKCACIHYVQSQRQWPVYAKDAFALPKSILKCACALLSFSKADVSSSRIKAKILPPQLRCDVRLAAAFLMNSTAEWKSLCLHGCFLLDARLRSFIHLLMFVSLSCSYVAQSTVSTFGTSVSRRGSIANTGLWLACRL